MSKIKFIVLTVILGGFCGCTFNPKTKDTSFVPLGAEAHEVIDVVSKDIKDCIDGKGCQATEQEDSYESSKLKAMTTAELEKHIDKLRKKKQK